MALPDTQQAIQLLRLPQGMPQAADFGLTRRPLPVPADGELLLRTHTLSLDPYLRPLLAGRYVVPPPALGTIVPGIGLAQVVGGDDKAFAPGTWVVAETGWCEYAVARPATLRRVDPGLAPLSTALGVLGIPGLTAWAGMKRIAQPHAGDTVLVSTAAGAVGSVVGQLARAAGCRVIGLTSSEAKQRIVVEEFGFDACVSYRSASFVEDLRSACPDGIDIYFDNVGGAVLEAALSILRLRARVVLCGLSDQYNRSERPAGPNLGPVIGARARLQGLVVYDHLQDFAQCQAELAAMIGAGTLRYREDVHHGLEQAPAGFIALLTGENRGKSLVQLAEVSA